MKRLILSVLLAGGLVACASQQRTGPPAPIVSVGKTPAPEPGPVARPKQAQPAIPPPPGDTVEVYAYKPPAAAPDAAPHPSTPVTESAPPAVPSPVSESAPPPATSPSTAKPRASSSGTAPAPAPQVVAYAPPAPSLSPAADTLIKQAEQQRQARDYVGAAATLERALGIQPREPYIWNRLARVRMEQGLYSQAGNLASRSNALAGDQPTLKQDNWGMIATARRAAGDTAGAAAAEQKARGG